MRHPALQLIRTHVHNVKCNHHTPSTDGLNHHVISCDDNVIFTEQAHDVILQLVVQCSTAAVRERVDDRDINVQD